MPPPRRAPLLILLAATACASTADGPELPPGWRLEPPTTLLHEPTGLGLPARWRGLARGDPLTRDERGADVVIAYRDTAGDMVLTLAIYPKSSSREATPADHFDRELLALAKRHEGSRVEENAPMNLPLGYAARPGFGAFLHWPAGDTETGSFLILIPRGERYFRVDSVFALDGSQERVEGAWRTLLAFLRSLEPEETKR